MLERRFMGDAELVLAVATRRDLVAFNFLFVRYVARVRSFLLHRGTPVPETEELIQEVMLAVWRRAETYDARRASPARWILGIARKKRFDLLRRRMRQPTDGPDGLADLIAADDDMDAALSVRDALDALPAEQRHVMKQAYFEGKSLHDIARDADLPVGTVKSRHRLAMRRLRRAFSRSPR